MLPKPVYFNYQNQPKEIVKYCNLCGSSNSTPVAFKDRYGFPAITVACLSCGLVYLNPRMTAEAYRKFYEGTYRALVSLYHGMQINSETIQTKQYKYAADLGDLLRLWMGALPTNKLLDIGGSTGVVARHLADMFEFRATVVDPAPMELAAAERRNLITRCGLIEQTDFKGEFFSLITICQAVDHLLDIKATLMKARTLLLGGGLLFVDIVDFNTVSPNLTNVEEAIKIDHPYYLTAPTMEQYLESTGFRIIKTVMAADKIHRNFVCRPKYA